MPVRVAVEKVAGLVDVIMPLKMLRIALSAFAVGAKIEVGMGLIPFRIY